MAQSPIVLAAQKAGAGQDGGRHGQRVATSQCRRSLDEMLRSGAETKRSSWMKSVVNRIIVVLLLVTMISWAAFAKSKKTNVTFTIAGMQAGGNQ